MEGTHLRRPWPHSLGWTTQGQQPCRVVASSQGQVAAGAGPVHQPVRAPRLRWQLCGKAETGRWLSMEVSADRCFILFRIRERLQQGNGTVSWVSVWCGGSWDGAAPGLWNTH